ncbi:hypothetical protein CLOM_g13028 [Closterium sp. NIES-68]|nr:hypothetical protein CLOM_g13028 [Closterium sp. NIES-68]GJP72166.1 hypothetical protein CLOP_g2921 [Closterium sp. NIES-67]
MASSSQVDVSQKLRESDDLLKQGDAILDGGDIETAIQLFGSALESRVSAFGELGAECAVAYFKYGSALFAKAQRDMDVLGPAGQKLEKGKEEEKEEDVEGEEDEASKAKGKGKGKVEETDDGAESPDAADAADEAGEEDLGEGEDGEEEESDQELAWRLLETARCIYAKRDTRSLEEVDVVTTLADLSLEKEDFDECMEDYQHALQLLGVLVSPHHRRVIELYFKMALANQTGNRAAEALRCCRLAIDACEARIGQAQTLLEARRKLKEEEKEGGESVSSGKATGKTDGGDQISDTADKAAGAATGDAAAENAAASEGAAVSERAAAGAEVKKGAAQAAGEEEKEGDVKKAEGEAGAGVGRKGGEEKGEAGKSALDKGKGKGKAEEGRAMPYDSIDGSSSEEDLLQEIQDVRQIASDLKEKAEELLEMIRLPSVEAMLREQLSAAFSGAGTASSAAARSTSRPSSSAAAATAAAASSGPAATASAPAAAAAATAAPALASAAAPAAAAAGGCGKAVEGEQRGQKRAAEVVVVGRGKKRATPVPIPPEEAAVLSWPGVAS